MPGQTTFRGAYSIFGESEMTTVNGTSVTAVVAQGELGIALCPSESQAILKTVWKGLSVGMSGGKMMEKLVCNACSKRCRLHLSISEEPPTECIEGLLA